MRTLLKAIREGIADLPAGHGGRSLRVAGVLLLWCGAIAPLPAAAQAGEAQSDSSVAASDEAVRDSQGADPWGPEPPGRPGSGPRDDVQLDTLLRLPSSFEQKPSERRAGGDEVHWRARFAQSRTRIEDEQANLEKTVQELEEVAGGAGGYNVAPPGAQAEAATSPVSFRLRQELKRRREAVDDAEREYRALVVQADLAEVPDAWRSPGESSESRPSAGAVERGE